LKGSQYHFAVASLPRQISGAAHLKHLTSFVVQQAAASIYIRVLARDVIFDSMDEAILSSG
jgi:hypothetical protein